jgi:hypothetical protein
MSNPEEDDGFGIALRRATLLADQQPMMHWIDQQLRYKSKNKFSLGDVLNDSQWESVRFYKPAPESTQDENGHRSRDKRIANAWREFKRCWDEGDCYEDALDKACIDAKFGTRTKDAAAVLIDVIENRSGASRVREIIGKTAWKPPSYFKESNRRRKQI